VPFTVRAGEVAEIEQGEPAAVSVENALRKARAAVQPGESELIIGCDTLVALDGVIYGKPADEDDARRILMTLSGRTHEVLSGLAVLREGAEQSALERTWVTFREIGEDMIEWYLARGEWRGRAGGYAIQGAGAALVRAVEGDYQNVVGLPLARLLDLCPGLLAS
jgi:septum formation protein